MSADHAADEIKESGSQVQATLQKPRARLGPTQIVQLENSDSEDEDEGIHQDDGGEDVDPDFLRSYPEDTVELQLQHLRLKTDILQALNFPRFGKSLERLCLRQNELTSPLPSAVFEGLDKLAEVDFYDNRLGPIVEDEELIGMPNVTSLDLSFNTIRRVPTLPSLKKVKILYLVQNKISKVEKDDVEWAKDTLTSIELGGNRIRVIENMESLVHLTELWLGKNKIRKLENLDAFTSLKILSIQSNRITKIEGLENLVNLEEIYLSHNGLTKIEGLEHNTKLRTLDVGNNMITEIEGVSHLTDLEEFWASYNQIPNLRALDKELAPLKKLETVYLEGNPCQRNDMTGYRRKIMLALPQINQIDATHA